MNQDIIAQYQAQKQQCEISLQEANTQLAISNNQLEQLKLQAEQQFGTSDVNKLNHILIELNNQKAAYEAELQKLNG